MNRSGLVVSRLSLPNRPDVAGLKPGATILDLDLDLDLEVELEGCDCLSLLSWLYVSLRLSI